MELEVVWNGAHNNRNDDLLMARCGPPRHDRPPDRRQNISAIVLNELARGAGTLAELGARTGLDTATVNGALYHLRRAGFAEVRTVDFGTGIYIYGLTGGRI